MYRIFIVEDDETIAKMVAKHLEKWDYEVRTVKDFSNVMTEFVDFDPQLVLMDIRLPFLMGITGAQKYEMFPRCRSSFCHRWQII